MAIHTDLVLAIRFLGHVASFVGFLVPVPKFYRVFKKKTTKGLESAPYIAELFSAMLWLFYAYVKTGEMLLLAANAFGCVVETLYLTIYIIYCPKKARMCTLMLILLLNFGGFCVIVLLTLVLAKEAAARVKLLGWICVVITTISDGAAPLSVIIVAIRIESVEYLPSLWLLVTKVISAIIRFLYGLVLKDIFVILPNAVRISFGIVQMVVYAMYRKNKNAGEDKEKLEMVIVEIGDQKKKDQKEKPQVMDQKEQEQQTKVNDVDVEKARPQPKKGKIVVEVYGAYSHLTGKAACGGVIKDDRNCVVEAFTLKLLSGNNLTADLWGCLMGLKRASEKGYREVILRSDSTEALKLVDSDILETDKEWELVMEIKKMVERNWNVVTQLIIREQNSAADSLAKKALNGAFGLLVLGPSAMHAYLNYDIGS